MLTLTVLIFSTLVCIIGFSSPSESNDMGCVGALSESHKLLPSEWILLPTEATLVPTHDHVWATT